MTHSILLPSKPPGESKTGPDATTLRQSSSISLLRLTLHVSRDLSDRRPMSIARRQVNQPTTASMSVGDVSYFQRVESPAAVRNKRPERPDSSSPACANPDGCTGSFSSYLT
ncbi:unnamed protein product [Lasius platythorax]|uniref:Uncharacterized protein n=1 Tax=Lasius platythorax TaxID=488582 RepID=A0AAV2NQQ2_9HYME